MEEYNDILFDELLKLASKKDADAQAELSKRYYCGISTEKDVKSAIEWAEKAYSRGRADIISKLADMCLEYSDIDPEYAPKAVKYYLAGADDNNMHCLGMLSLLYHEGRCGLNKDEGKFASYAKKAMDKGIGTDEDKLLAQLLMGMAYFEGTGVESDIYEALSRYSISVSGGLNEVYPALARYYAAMGVKDVAEYYTYRACHSESRWISSEGMGLFERMLNVRINSAKPESYAVKEFINETDRAISDNVNELYSATSNYDGFEPEANRLIKNAETMMNIGNYKRVYPAYDKAADEYPADFRGWYNMARVFTNNFAVYSVFPEEDFGKADKPEFYENMTYAFRTVEPRFENNIKTIASLYYEGSIDASLMEFKNAMYKFYNDNASFEDMAEYLRKNEEKLIYLYNKRDSVTVTMGLHLLYYVLNSDNIKKYNEKVIAHNKVIDVKIEQKIQEYVNELAQNLRIDRPKDFSSNADALDHILNSNDYKVKVENFRSDLRSKQDYYTEIPQPVSFDEYDPDTFGRDKIYYGFKPEDERDFDDDFLDFIIAFAARCGIPMYGYEVFYSPQRKMKNIELGASVMAAASLQAEYYNAFNNLKKKYTEFDPYVSDIFAEYNDILANYAPVFDAYDKATSISAANAFKTVFKGKELKETREDITAEYEAVLAEVNEVAERVFAQGKAEFTAINQRVLSGNANVVKLMLIRDDNYIDELLNKAIAGLKKKYEDEA